MEYEIKSNNWEITNKGDYWISFNANGHHVHMCQTQWGRFGATLYTLHIDGKTMCTGGKWQTCISKVKKYLREAQ